MPKILTDADIDAFRESLCDVAEELFAAHGPAGVTIRQLADALGVSPMTPYRYFENKDAILAAVRARAFDRFADAMEKAQARLRRKGGHQPDPAYLDFALANRSAYRMMFDTEQPTFASYPQLVAAMDRARATMTAGWNELKAAGRFTGDAELAGRLMWAAMHGAVMLELAGFLRKPLDARKLGMAAIQALAKQIAARAR
jgi:AcrR family transcriptional regulator